MIRLKHFFAHWTNWIAMLLVLVYVYFAIAAPYLSPEDPKNPGMYLRVGRAAEARPQPPSEKAILGMLPFGFDVYHSLIWGARDALQFGLIVTLTTAVFGILYGAVAGISSPRVGTVMLRIADAFLAFPPIAGLVFLQQLINISMASLGQVGFFSPFFLPSLNADPVPPLLQLVLDHLNPLMLSLIIFSWMPYARLVNAMVLTLKQTDFVQAARALGGSPFWIIRKHLIQNATGPAMVLAARDVGGVVLFQATLTFIGLGGASVWGSMLAQGRNWVIGPGGSLFKYWWVFLPPTLAVMVFGIAWNILGDGLHDVFEQSSQQEYYGPSFWNRLFGKRTKRQSQEEVSSYAMLAASGAHVQSGAKSDSPNGSNAILLTARDYVLQGQVSQALHSYQHLIQRGRLISEILPDLALLAKKYPHEPQVWQALGDALNRSGDTTHAAQSYDRARKLIG